MPRHTAKTSVIVHNDQGGALLSPVVLAEERALVPATNAKPRAHLGARYQLAAPLGVGGAATVYRAYDHRANKWVALKRLTLPTDPQARRLQEALFAREYHTLARIRHHRIVEVYDYGVDGDGPYYAMELLDGEDLGALAPLPHGVACRHLRDVASSLALIHTHRLVHRDISPRNVRITSDGRAKLIDFGALASFGVSGQIIGTPPYTAPESVRHMPLDHRTDLYSLGATAYFLLTRRHAYPARRHTDLATAWKLPPPPPSTFDDTIPPDLDALVLSLLRLDPGARPATAAAVIEQLTSLVKLEPEELELTGESYLQSGELVGRDEQMRSLRSLIEQAGAGRGGTIIVEGPAGTGRTRLLNEACLAAQLGGLTLVKGDGQRHAGPFGIVKALTRSLLQGFPEATGRAATEHAGLLGHLMRDIHRQLGAPRLTPLAIDPSERRARFQVALQDIFVRVAKDHPYAIAVDDIDRADDASVAFLAGLAAEATSLPLALLLTRCTSTQATAPGSLDALRRRSERLSLPALDAYACDKLVISLFGGAVNSGRLSHLLYEKSTGNPQRCMDLAQLLAKRGIVRYVGGTWVLPQDVSRDELPESIEDLVATRLESLSSSARALAEALSVFEYPVDVVHALAVAQTVGQTLSGAHAALDELFDEQFLSGDGQRYAFAQRALREGVLARVEPGRRRAHHRRAAELLVGFEPSEVDLVQAGLHLLRAGDEVRGADLLLATARKLFGARLEPEGYAQLADALLAALAVYDKHGRGDHAVAGPLFALMSVGFLVDWRIAVEHGERAIAVGLRLTGLGLAARLASIIGSGPALLLGLGSAWLRFARRRLLGDRYGPMTAIREFCAIVPPTIAAWILRYDSEGAARLTRQLAPLRLFGPGHVTTLMHDYGIMQVRMVEGRDREVNALCEHLLRRFEHPRVKRMIGELHWKMLRGGVLITMGILACYSYRREELAIIDELERLDVTLWRMGANQLRLLHHALRGESDEIEHDLNRVELFAIQGGTTWQVELYWPFLLLPCYIEMEDVLGARRCIEQLERRAQGSPSMAFAAELGRAALLTLRDDSPAALAVFERRRADLKPDTRAAWPVMRGWYAKALIDVSRCEDARAVLEETLAVLGSGDHVMLRHVIEARRLLAMCEAGLGRLTTATAIVDDLLADHGQADQPLVVGGLHRTRAQLAAWTGDQDAFDRHVAAMGRQFRITRNPVLISQWERLAAMRKGDRQLQDLEDDDELTAVTGSRGRVTATGKSKT